MEDAATSSWRGIVRSALPAFNSFNQSFSGWRRNLVPLRLCQNKFPITRQMALRDTSYRQAINIGVDFELLFSCDLGRQRPCGKWPSTIKEFAGPMRFAAY
jgi:hypothetical protein